MIMMWFKKTWLIALVTALSFGSFPLVTALAQGVTDLPTGTPTPSTPTDHLANIWSREMDAYTKIGSFLTQSDVIIQKIQEKINKAKENGRDVTNVQAALDAFAKAIKEAEPLYENAGELIASHPGFDVNGKVLDPYQGVVTVKNLRDTLVEIRQLLIGPRQALRDAIKGFREANNPLVTPSPSQSGG